MRNLFNDLKIPVNTVKFTSPFTCISHLLFDELNYSRKHDHMGNMCKIVNIKNQTYVEDIGQSSYLHNILLDTLQLIIPGNKQMLHKYNHVKGNMWLIQTN